MKAIHVESLKKSFGTEPVLNGLNLEVEEGEFYALMGPNGSGKSTLSAILASVTQFDNGTVEIYGKSPAAARGLIAYIPQENFSVPQLSGRENLLYFANLLGIAGKDARALADNLLEKVGLTADADKRFAHYSGGMKKRLELATALFPGIRLLILDEPTTGLDPGARRDFFALLKNVLAKHTATLLITHLGSDAEAASRVGLIDKGQIIAEGTPAGLRSRYAAADMLTIETVGADGACENILKSVKDVQKVAALQNGYRICVGDASQVLPEIVRTLNQAGIPVNRTEVARPTLEDVFFALTERTMQEVPVP
jgi:ABC-2 type transport system ATP-binding protein